MNQKLAILMLRRFGYEVEVVEDGIKAIEVLERDIYDLVLMDIQMPRMDGIAATQYIRQEHAQEKQPYIIAITANVGTEDREKCIHAGMNDYIAKPFQAQELVTALEKAYQYKIANLSAR